MANRRSYIRYNQRGSVKIKTERDTPDIVKGDLIDICFMGFCVYLKEKIDINTPIQFELMAKLNHRPLIGRGKIKSIKEAPRYGVQGFRVGVEFTDVNKKEIEILINQIQSKIARDKTNKSINGEAPF